MAKKKKKRSKSLTSTKKQGRVRNATPNEVNGIQFKSKLESYCYKKLLENNIEAKYEKEKITLIEPFEFNGKKIRATTYTPDFVGDNFIIECKGYFTEVAKLKWKLFLKYALKYMPNYKIYIPMSIKQINNVIEDILNENNKRHDAKKSS